MEETTVKKLSHEELIKVFCTFLEEIGITVEEGEVDDSTFLPGLEISNGRLILDRKRLLYPGDILHEAGHIAVTPSAERESLNGNIVNQNPGRAGDELAVMLWTYAACRHLGVPEKIVFHVHGYKGESEWIMSNYKDRNFIGMPLLVWMGMARPPEGENGFPAMLKWLRN